MTKSEFANSTPNRRIEWPRYSVHVDGRERLDYGPDKAEAFQAAAELAKSGFYFQVEIWENHYRAEPELIYRAWEEEEPPFTPNT